VPQVRGPATYHLLLVKPNWVAPQFPLATPLPYPGEICRAPQAFQAALLTFLLLLSTTLLCPPTGNWVIFLGQWVTLFQRTRHLLGTGLVY